MIIFFDIETVALSFSKKEIDVKFLENFSEKFVDKKDFMPEFNKILTITVGMFWKEGEKIENLPGSEEDQIKKFFELVDKKFKVKKDDKEIEIYASICGHNIKSFDIPFIIKRALYYGMPIPDRLKAYGKKPWEMDHFIDLFEAYKYLSFSGAGSLDLICNFLGITSPKDEGIDGSQVQKFYDEGKEAEILEYCKRDVKATMDVFKKFVDLNLI